MAKLERRTIKATFSLDVNLVARLDAVATLRSTSRNAIATAALEEAVKGLVLFDRAKPIKRGQSEVSAEIPIETDPDGEKAVA